MGNIKLFDNAVDVKLMEDKCPKCRVWGEFYSYSHEKHEKVFRMKEGELWEHCGFYCNRCKWGNAGMRKVK